MTDVRNLAYIALALVLACAGGVAAGWHAKGVSVDAASTTQAHAETQAIVADVAKQSAEQHAQMAAEQGKSQGLATDQHATRAAGAAVREEIHHALFVPAPIAVADSYRDCSDPSGTAEFMRIYQAASRGSPTASGSTGAE